MATYLFQIRAVGATLGADLRAALSADFGPLPGDQKMDFQSTQPRADPRGFTTEECVALAEMLKPQPPEPRTLPAKASRTALATFVPPFPNGRGKAQKKGWRRRPSRRAQVRSVSDKGSLGERRGHRCPQRTSRVLANKSHAAGAQMGGSRRRETDVRLLHVVVTRIAARRAIPCFCLMLLNELSSDWQRS